MQQAVPWYLSKRADLERWPLHADSTEDVDTVVVIPCLAERAYLPATLSSLATNSPRALKRTLVICVVNNREPEHADPGDVEDNQLTLRELRVLSEGGDTSWVDGSVAARVRVAYIDASSPGCELPPRDGVGLARKIGMDWAVSILEAAHSPTRVVCSLDADTTVAPNYLVEVRKGLAHEDAWAGVVHFEHPLPDDPVHCRAIVEYECFLRCHVHGLRHAGSPFAFHTVGSTIVCTPDAYVAVSGMNRKQGGEDFYFLQQLAKTGLVQPITTTSVYPSARPSGRVPFGTGPRVRQAMEPGWDEHAIYAPESYSILRDCLRIEELAGVDAADVLAAAGELGEHVREFLRDQDIENAWPRVFEGAKTTEQRRRKFHTWFDAFRSLKLIHYLRDNGRPNISVEEAALAWMPDGTPQGADPESFLEWLRDLDRAAGTTALGLG